MEKIIFASNCKETGRWDLWKTNPDAKKGIEDSDYVTNLFRTGNNACGICEGFSKKKIITIMLSNEGV